MMNPYFRCVVGALSAFAAFANGTLGLSSPAFAQDANRCKPPVITDLMPFSVPSVEQKDVLDAINWARTNPQGVIDSIERELRPLFTDPKTGKPFAAIDPATHEPCPAKRAAGQVCLYPRRMTRAEIDTRLPDLPEKERERATIIMLTKEGVSVLDETVAYLKKTIRQKRSFAPLKWNAILAVTAKELAEQQARDGTKGHDRPGVKPLERAKAIELSAAKGAVNEELTCFGENCAYGYAIARDVVVALIVDDGVTDRGHRENIYAGDFTDVGVALGSHPSEMRYATVMDFGCAEALPESASTQASAASAKTVSPSDAIATESSESPRAKPAQR